MMSDQDKITIALNKQVIYTMVRQAAIKNLQEVDLNEVLEFDYDNDILKIRLGMEQDVNLYDILKGMKNVK